MNLKQVIWVLSGLITLAQCQSEEERIATVEGKLGELTKLTKVHQIKAHFCDFSPFFHFKLKVSGFFKLFSYTALLHLFEHLNFKIKRYDQNLSIGIMILKFMIII